MEELKKQDVEDYRKNLPPRGSSEDKGPPSPEASADAEVLADKSEGKDEREDRGAELQEETLDPNEIFKEAYEEAVKRVPNAVPLEEIKKAFENWQEARLENPADRADREYAERLGVKPEDLRRYRNIVSSLEKITNPETGESVIQELRNLFARIISRRLKKAPVPQYPVEEGEELAEPAEAYSQVKSGNLEPKVWETTEIKEIKGKRFGEVEITLVCDRSSSMAQGSKMSEQRRSAVLMMEALKEFAEECDEERVNIDKPLEIRSEIYSFQATAQDGEPLKKMSKELGEKERIDATAVLSSVPGQKTTDFISLEAIDRRVTEETRLKIREGELKKIVIVFTDGESHGPDRVKTILEKMRGEGIIAVGIGITEAGRPALTTYASDARLAEKAEDLTLILTDLLKEHLADI